MHYLFYFKLTLFSQDSLVDVVILQADPLQSGTDFFFLFASELPGGNLVVGLEQGVLRHESVLSTEVIIFSTHIASKTRKVN